MCLSQSLFHVYKSEYVEIYQNRSDQSDFRKNNWPNQGSTLRWNVQHVQSEMNYISQIVIPS